MRANPRTTSVFLCAAVAAFAVSFLPRSAAADEKEACVAASDQAQTLRDEGKFKAARAQMVTCARDVCPGIVRRDCEKWLSDLDATQPTVVLGARDTKGSDVVGAHVFLDGVQIADHLDGKPIPIDPGEHTFRYETAGAAPVEQRAVVRVGEKNRILTAVLMPLAAGATPARVAVVTPTDKPSEPEPAPSTGGGAPVAAIVFGSVAVLAAGSFAYFGITGRSDVNNLRDTCAPNCLQSDVDSAHSKLIVADVSLGVGVVSLAAAAFFFFRHSSSASPPTQSALVPDFQPRPGGGVAGLTSRF